MNKRTRIEITPEYFRFVLCGDYDELMVFNDHTTIFVYLNEEALNKLKQVVNEWCEDE